MMKYFVFALLALFFAFVCVIIVRALAFKPKKQPELLCGEVEFDREKLEGKVLALPTREDIDSQIAEHMIVELYSK